MKPLIETPWKDAAVELPPIGERVEVRGKYTPEGYAWPIAYRRRKDIAGITDFNAPCNFTWESTEWRGQTGITHWRPIPKAPVQMREEDVTGVLGADGVCYSNADSGL